MGYEPMTLWLSSLCGWLEVKPCAEYREMYETMINVIGVYFCAVVNTEERANDGMLAPLSVTEDVQAILHRVSIHLLRRRENTN